ncbi:cysteine hydrolase family protein [Niveispirillum sp.]|uniref:cysteine hydrolase family protein n=1 Tax=Niveispirillum sp. TaxID=1917217 RepID=UPI001B59C9AC|nr:cysteine hydrolase family protein [Niveispirillum sp.]MBP7338259.1 cysteine hydrolase [Niveispirillum sp.]
MIVPRETALIVIDVQEGILPAGDGPRHLAAVTALDGVVARLADLQARARQAGVTLIHVQHDASDDHRLAKGTPGWEIRRELTPQPGERVIHKTTCDSFLDTGLKQALLDGGIRHVVIGGCMTPFCIDTSVRSAIAHGFDVTLLSDGHTTCDMGGLTFEQIIDHHNTVLGWFGTATNKVVLKKAADAL